MFAYPEESMEALTAPARQMFEMWISFFPTAPLFGVAWRFAPDHPIFTPNGATTEPEAAEAPAPQAPAVAKSPAGDGGSIERIRGIGPRLAAELNEKGITTVSQIAAMSEKDLAKIDATLTAFRGRCFRDDWIGQAKELMAAA